ncbi:DNA mismatch repair endonuclease MutL [Desulfogranum mediterraneum]|uniref:DNA mismatch repair endonuclease MutL n=1 Tax=Desulfogranum mediterraneum TaxID=160661 RepID=UPI00040A4A0C|nr:DNA mismatch repair endonuclease MutL [Desulfogranum mediterraneum]
MSRIRILSEHLSNQIAAGEVVERPASVIKELIENSVDAGAGRIDIQVEGSGVRRMRVADDGCGMVEDDVLLCLERHATSKIRDESQLAAIATLGFRGEALPSIGSVARMTILSRARERDTGTRAEIRYGVLHAVHEAGCSTGTIIEIQNLFANVPARKKFLKSARTETSHIEEAVRNQAMAMPELGFSLQLDQRKVLDYPPGGDLERRVRQVFRYDGPLLSLEHCGAGADETLQVGGYLLLPEAISGRRAKLRFLVNGRAVQDRMLRHSVIEGLQGFLMKGYQPAGVVTIQLPPEQVDVNVHPAKREIRFRNAQQIHGLVSRVVAAAIQAHQEHTREQLFTPAATGAGERAVERVREQEGAGPVAEALEQMPLPGPAPGRQPTGASPSGWSRSAAAEQAEPRQAREPGRPSKVAGAEQQEAEPLSAAADLLTREPSPPGSPTPAEQQQLEPEQLGEPGQAFGGLRLIGQLFSLYLLCEKDGHFIVIDQHAAHERILYGQLKQDYLERTIPRQRLLYPASVELGPDQMETLERYQDELVQFGLEVDYFGDTTWVIKSVPAMIGFQEPAATLHELLEALAGQGGRPQGFVAGVVDELLASMACKAAIKAGNRLAPEEMMGLLEQMEASGVFSHCPHGRPVIKLFSRTDLEKWFHRHGG